MFKKQSPGFTLVELLVVISIIGVLAALLVANFVGARNRASDVSKKSDLRQIKTALQLYYNDYQYYPGTAFGLYIKGCGAAGDENCVPPAAFSAGSGPSVYMGELPVGFTYKAGDPSGVCEPTRQSFLLSVVLENASDEDIAASQAKCDPTSRCYYSGTPAAVDYFVCEN